MNKNQKRVPYTFTKLIFGNEVVARFHVRTIADIEERIFKLEHKNKPVPPELRENLRYHKAQLEDVRETISRYRIAYLACGNPTTLIR